MFDRLSISLVPHLEDLVLHHPVAVPTGSPAENPVAVLVLLQLVPACPVVRLGEDAV